ncbi:MAG: ERAP1-like C-terminal domain-containing protein, partial [Myxococcales bacterium]|nr:ERAP1-like C-terminal domain-containing protein [Myxococcales bacterium]
RSDRYRGEVAIEVDVARARRRIELHAVDLRVARARVVAGERALRARVVAHPERQAIALELPATLPRGRARIELAFQGRLRRDLSGLYGATAGERRYAFTQLEPADARKLAPCFDEPAMKARWQIAVSTGVGNAVVSNAPVEHVELPGDGTKTVRFARTPRLSSYLVALAVGELACSRAERAGDTEIRVWHLPGKEALVDFGLEAARETLVRLERYFDLPYPYAKLDLVAVPDFEFGAMENAGAVFFRETLLLLDPKTATLAEKKRAAEVICHELAHMWYGDLVTMAWWDDLWLNEAFATWMAFQIVDEWQPTWRMWHDFFHHRAGALDLDALANTHPIYAPVRTPEEANENFDLITYEKGASVVRMLERYLGPATFREGVRTYIRRHAEGNAVAADLWRALGEAAGEPVEPIARAWIEQSGYPVVRVRRAPRREETALELRQERFFEARPRGARAGAETRAVRWPVPWVGRVGTDAGAVEVRHLLAKRSDVVALPAGATGFVYGNADEGGFFRPLHGEGELDALVDALPALSPAERMGLVDHQWALTRAGEARIDSLLDIVNALGAETDPDVLTAAKRPLASLATRLAPDVSRECERRLRAWVEVAFGAQVDELGFDAGADEDDATRVRRGAIVELVGQIGQATRVVDEASERCRRYLADRASLEPNLADPVVSIAAAHGDAWLYDALERAMREARTPQEQRRFLFALCDFESAELVERTLALALTDAVPSQDVAFVIVRLLGNRAARERTWDFARARWSRLRERMGALLASRVLQATPLLGTRAHRLEVARFFRANPVPSGARTLRQALERFESYEALLAREGPRLEGYLRDPAEA